jgi:SP family myo-inositol transporter-like MFS transporter 13
LHFDDTWPGISDEEIEVSSLSLKFILLKTIVSLATLGAAFGSILGGPFADKYGRKPTIILADILFAVGAIVMGIAGTIPVLLVGRFIVGVSFK